MYFRHPVTARGEANKCSIKTYQKVQVLQEKMISRFLGASEMSPDTFSSKLVTKKLLIAERLENLEFALATKPNPRTLPAEV